MIPKIRSKLSRWVRRGLYAAPLAIIALWLIMLNHLAPPPRPMDGAEPSLQDRSRIIGADDRTAVADPTALPWRSIGQIRAWWGTQGFTGTGVLIAPNQVVTAAHCVYRTELGGWAGDVTFTPARTGNTAPFGTARVIRYAVPREYTERKTEALDIVLITLDQPVGDETGWLTVASQAQADTSVDGTTLHSAGYPADQSGGMYAVSGVMSFMSSSDGVWRIDLDATFGQSGSPIWINAPADGQPLVVGVLVAELDSGRANLAAPISAELIAQLGSETGAEPSIALAPVSVGDVLVSEPGDAGSPLIASPISACGAGIAPMMLLSIGSLAASRAASRRS